MGLESSSDLLFPVLFRDSQVQDSAFKAVGGWLRFVRVFFVGGKGGLGGKG